MLKFLLLLSCALPCSAVVVAGGGYNDNNDWWQDGAKQPDSFGILDENGDGKVSKAELGKAQDQLMAALKRARASLLAAVDKDSTGKISRYEAQEAKPRWVSLRDRAKEICLAGLGADSGGALTDAQRLKLDKAMGMVFLNAGTARIDSDGDKVFSQAEIEKAIKGIVAGDGTLFTLCDRNNDGQLSVQESKLAFDLLAVAAGMQPLP